MAFKVAIIGSGLIGRSFAMIFASGGMRVNMYDQKEDQVAKARADIHDQLKNLDKQGMLRGGLSVDEQYELITAATDIKSAVKDAFFVLECVFERLDVKRAVWAEIDPLVTDDVILSSSTSALLPSAISEGMTHKSSFVIAHPTNPPFYCPAVEVVPAAWTRAEVTDACVKMLSDLGMVPVLVRKEVNGFVLNRLQDAIFAEAWRLIRDEVVTPVDLEKIMTSGLGMRYAFVGPWETAYLNARGMDDYVDKYADMIYGIQQDQGPAEKMEKGATLDAINRDMAALAGPVDQLPARRQWRDARLAALAKLKQNMDAQDAKGK